MRLSVSLVILLLVTSYTCPAAEKPKAGGPVAGGLAPSFALLDVQGEQHRLNDWKGRIVVLNFWAFWCDTWKEEMPHLRELAEREKDLGFKLVCISVDGTRLPEFRRRAGAPVPWPVLLDVGGRVSRQYKIAHVPTVVIVDAHGRVRTIAEGYPGNHAVLREVARLHRKPAQKAEQSRD